MRLLIFFVFVSSLFAGPPMKINDPFVPNLGEFEINIAIEVERKDDTLVRAPIVDFNYGIMQNVQFTLEGAYINSHNQNDIDGLEVALKWHFYEGEILSVALYPKYKSYPIDSIFHEAEALEISIPVNVILNESFSLVVDTVYVMPKDTQKHLEFGTYLKYKNSKHTFYGAMFFEDNPYENEILIFGAMGYKYQFHKNVAYMISYEKEVGTTDRRAAVLYSGLQFVF